jgi:Flp pilus assembly protein TadG
MQRMTRESANRWREEGSVLIIVCGFLIVLLAFAGLAIDGGRAYLLKAQLTKAVDGAALAGARAFSTSSATTPEKDEATRIFRANLPAGYMGATSVTNPASDPNFFTKVYDSDSGANIITINAQATLPLTFMRLLGINQVTVAGSGEARRRLVDLSLVIDCSGSIGSDWTTVRDAARRFINSFDERYDRFAITLFSDGAHVAYPMPAPLGFVKTTAMNSIPASLPTGSTSMADGFYRAWDELRSVPAGSQSGLRVIVLFTDGTPNGVPGTFQWRTGPTTYVRELNTNDFPSVGGNTTNNPSLFGLSYQDCSSGTPPHCSDNPTMSAFSTGWNSTTVSSDVPWLPAGATSTHANQRSSGMPTSFPLQSATLRVNGVVQSTARDLRNYDSGSGKYPAEIHNVNNAARNLLEILANAARSEYPTTGDYPIRVYTIGMGAFVNYNLGTIPERSADILKRISNDKTSTDYNSAQIAGKYYYAATATDVDPAFQALRNEIVRLSK